MEPTHPIRAYRNKHAIPLNVAARDLGLSRTQLWRIESGRQEPQPDFVKRVFDWSGREIDPNALFAAEAAE